MAFLTAAALAAMGFRSIGKNLEISDRASFYGNSNISLADDVRIDDFCVVSAGTGGLSIGQHVHVAVHSSIIISDFCNISSRVAIYSSNDDYSGAAMTNPTVPAVYTNVHHAAVFLGRHVIVGSGSVVLPGVTLHDGVAIGALSLANRDCAPFGVFAGNPLRWIKDRQQGLLELERQFRGSTQA